MPNLSAGFRITGAKDAQGQVTQFSPKALKNIQRAANDRAQVAVNHFKQAMDAAYQSQWATGRLARSIKKNVEIRGNGVDVNFTISNERELEFITALLGGHFRHFPVGPFVILPVSAKLLFIRYPGRGRQFIRGKGGRFAGSKPGPGIRVKQVLWGKKTGGFARDVLSEVAQVEGAAFIKDMEEAVAGVIAQTKS